MYRLSMETWKPINDYPGYEVSSLGNIRKLKKRMGFRQLRPWINSSGYNYVTLYDSRLQRHRYRVHRLVAEAFVEGKSETKNLVDHIDGNKNNNQAANLRWTDSKGNIANKSGTIVRLIHNICLLRDQGKSEEDILNALLE